MEIQSTTDYDLFKIMDANREVSRVHVKQLVESITERNLLALNPIICNSYFEVIDGQHRLEAARSIGCPIYYVIADKKANIHDVLRLNTTSRTWRAEDYMASYIDQGKSDYETLEDFCKNYDQTVMVAVELLSGVGRWTRLSYIFKNGLFKATDLEKAEKLSELLLKFSKFAEFKIHRDKTFVRAIQKITANTRIDLDNLFHKLEVIGKPISKQKSTSDYLRWFEDVYNFKSHDEGVRFF